MLFREAVCVETFFMAMTKWANGRKAPVPQDLSASHSRMKATMKKAMTHILLDCASQSPGT